MITCYHRIMPDIPQLLIIRHFPNILRKMPFLYYRGQFIFKAPSYQHIVVMQLSTKKG